MEMSMAISELVRLIVIDILLVVGWSLVVGWTAPRWPDGWLKSDPFPLHLWPFERVARYRRLGVPALARRLPELGAAFGGASKAMLPGWSASDLRSYVLEVRRAEWVHWLSIAGCLPLALFNPWWLFLPFAAVVIVGNALFLLILRHNRLRLTCVLARQGQRGGNDLDEGMDGFHGQ
jgi:hypothetical protein